MKQVKHRKSRGNERKKVYKEGDRFVAGESVREMEKSVRGSNRQMYDSVSNPYGREGIHPLTAASRPDEV